MSEDDRKRPDESETESIDGSARGADRPRIERLGPFKLEATIGVGGMGTIYRAYDESMKRTVALKVLHASLEISWTAQTRFVREAWIAGRLDHPNIIKVYTRGEENRVSYIAMELAESGSLSDYIEQTSESIPSGADISETTDRNYINLILEKFIGLAQALEHIHAKDFIHRDIKPHNILLAGPDRDFKLTDFGIAHAEDMTRMTRAGDFIGTVRYMSPELIAAHRGEVDKRTDIYSLGVTLYEALTLTLPFKAHSEEKLISEILAGHYIEARKTNRRISRDLETLLMKATHYDPDMRYQTAVEFAEDLQRIIDGRPIVAKRQSVISRGIKYVRRNYRVVLGIAAAVIVVASGFLWQHYRAEKAYRSAIDKSVQQAHQQEMGRKPIFTKIRIPTYPGNGVLSPDGERLAFASDGTIWTVPLHGKVDPNLAGEPVKLTDRIGAWNYGTINTLDWSRDGKRIAFNVQPIDTTYTDKIYVVPSDGGRAKEVPIDLQRGSWIVNQRVSLSPDGRGLAYSSADEPLSEPHTGPPLSRLFIRTVSIEGTEEKQITSIPSREPVFSPDGEKIAFIAGGRPKRSADTTVRLYERPEQAVYVVNTLGGQPILVADLPGWESYPIWSPDGRMIAFLNEPEEGKYELGIVPVAEDGSQETDPIVIEPPTQNFKLAGWSTNNQIGICAVEPAHFAVYTVPVTGGRAIQITPEGRAEHPRWTPDGSRIFYHTENGEVAWVSAEGGIPEVIPHLSADWKPRFHPHYYGPGNAVSPDGSTLVVSGTKKGVEGTHLWIMSSDGSELRQLTSSPPPYEDCFPCWSPGGDSIAFTRYRSADDSTTDQCNIFVVSVDGGEPRQVTADEDTVAWSVIAWSPTGESIAFRSYYSTAQDPRAGTIKTISVNGGTPRIVTDVKGAYVTTSLTWSPDGTRIAYDYDEKSIQVISLEDSTITEVKTGLGNVGPCHVSWSPDGEKMAFAAYRKGEESFYLMEKFLPLLQPDRSEPSAEPENKELTVTMVWSGDKADGSGMVSADGEFLPFIDWETGNLAVRWLNGGETQYLTDDAFWSKKRSDPDQYADSPIPSPDGKLIAYTWYTCCTDASGGDLWSGDLYLINPDGTNRRVLLDCGHNVEAYPTSFSPDGSQIAVSLYDSTAWQIALVSTDDGSIRVLRESGGHPIFSTDGRYLAYEHVREGPPANVDIFLMSVDGTDDAPLIQHPANDQVLGWVPGSNLLLFLSDRSGNWDAWLIQVQNGQVVGQPRLARKNIGDILPLGFTRDSAFYYDVFSRWQMAGVGRIDSVAGEVVTPLEEPVAGSAGVLAWSPDGEYVAYVSRQDAPALPGGRRDIINVRSLRTGEQRQLSCQPDLIRNRVHWSPDSRYLLVRGMAAKALLGSSLPHSLCLIDVERNDDTLILQNLSWGRMGGVWSLDGGSIYFVDHDSLVMLDLASGRKTPLYRESGLQSWLSLSPNGEQLLLSARRDGRDCILILSLSSGETRELFRNSKADVPQKWWTFEWTPDGQHVLFSILQGDKQGPTSLWRIPSEGGEAEKILHTREPLTELSVHPNGREISVTSVTRSEEIWMMEHFLPKQ